MVASVSRRTTAVIGMRDSPVECLERGECEGCAGGREWVSGWAEGGRVGGRQSVRFERVSGREKTGGVQYIVEVAIY